MDGFTREALEIEVDTSLPGLRVVRVLEGLKAQRTETEAHVHRQRHRVHQPGDGSVGVRERSAAALHHAGRPMENGYIESFNGKFRDECLNENWFLDWPMRGARSPTGSGTTITSARTRRSATDADGVSQNHGRQQAVEKTAAEPPWKTLRVSHFPTASTAARR